MRTWLVKTPSFLKWLYPSRIWSLPPEDRVVYITFDDGPIPDITPWVLDTLNEYKAKATFFCIGDNVKKHPELFRRILSEGHSVGNHTYNHVNGWKTSTSVYIENCKKAEDVFQDVSNLRLTSTRKLFRPPYGKLSFRQSSKLRKLGYKIVMWDVLTFDFHPKFRKEQCLHFALKNTEAGSVIVFHDSLKAEPKLRYTLPKLLDFARANNYKLKAL
ncbi:MAG: polysaccharide deacetylase family protein [Flavobacterium sp.]|nr:MAG: polysaccharide deacetylase family protein [Flavobacterium sp.]